MRVASPSFLLWRLIRRMLPPQRRRYLNSCMETRESIVIRRQRLRKMASVKPARFVESGRQSELQKRRSPDHPPHGPCVEPVIRYLPRELRLAVIEAGPDNAGEISVGGATGVRRPGAPPTGFIVPPVANISPPFSRNPKPVHYRTCIGTVVKQLSSRRVTQDR